jgi:hypothetical protein
MASTRESSSQPMKFGQKQTLKAQNLCLKIPGGVAVGGRKHNHELL